MIGPDNSGASLAIAGFQGIDQMRREAEERRRQQMPIPQALADYYQRVMNGEDPAQLGREAAAHPEIRQHIEGLRQNMVRGQPAQPQLSHVGPGAGGPGYPALYTPQGTRNDMPPMQGLPPQGQPSPHQQSAAAIAPSQPQSQYTQSLAQMGQPMQGAPQVAQPEGPAYPQQPGGGRAYPRAEFPAPKFQGGDTIAHKDQPAFAAAAQQAAGFNSRERIASEQARVKEVVAATRSDMAMKIAELKARGVDDATLVKLMLGQMQEQGKQERFVEGEGGRTERAKIGASAQMGAAKTRAEAPREDPAEKELRSLQQEMGSVVSKPDWTKDPASVAEAARIQARIVELHRYVGREGPSSPGPLEGPAAPGAKAGPGKTPQPGAGKKAAPGGKSGGKIRVKLMKTGQVGRIDPAEFNAATMQKL